MCLAQDHNGVMPVTHQSSTVLLSRPYKWVCAYSDNLNQSAHSQSGPEVIKLFSFSTRLSTTFILLINVKMPTIIGILTFISMINTTPERLKERDFFICLYFSFYGQLKKSYNLGAWSVLVFNSKAVGTLATYRAPI